MTNLSLDMDSDALHDWIVSNGPVHVVFNKKSEDKESYPEDGIQCIITAVVKNDPEVYTWKVDYRRFEVLNSLHESNTYYGPAPGMGNEKRPGYLTAYATRHYKPVDILYVEPSDRIGDIMHSIQPASALDVSIDAVEQRFSFLKKDLEDFSG